MQRLLLGKKFPWSHLEIGGSVAWLRANWLGRNNVGGLFAIWEGGREKFCKARVCKTDFVFSILVWKQFAFNSGFLVQSGRHFPNFTMIKFLVHLPAP